MEYPWARKRDLKFEERKHQERVVCERTPDPAEDTHVGCAYSAPSVAVTSGRCI